MTRRSGQLALASVHGVEVAHWDPLRRTGIWGSPTITSRPVRNFGDLLGPVIVGGLVRQLRLGAAAEHGVLPRLLAIGSVLHLAEPSDVVWGAGMNVKTGTELLALPTLDLRAVRGPRTHDLLTIRFRQAAPAVFGDPGLLLGALFPRLRVAPSKRKGTVIVPNLNELAALPSRASVVNPRWPLRRVLRRIAASELVVGTSLHGIIVAESLGVPARAVRTNAEGAFKYEDYYLATGRDPDAVLADSVDEAIERGGAAPPVWDPRPLLAAFPSDLWKGKVTDARTEAIAARAVFEPD
jgi:pyruvyltransferase